MRNYQETVEWMFQQLPMYQRVGNQAYKVDLSNILALARHLQNPHKKFRSIHVAGTNGKGSVSHMLASIMQESGYKVGLYTSPHLKDFRERIKINGKEIEEKAVIDFIGENETFLKNQNLSFFEMTVGMAFDHFAREKVDIAVVEVGLGGRLDSTNIIDPEVSVITNIGMDHMQILGNSLVKIAGEKGGIIKPHTPVVVGEFQEEVFSVFKELADKCESPLYLGEDYKGEVYQSDLRGGYQDKNVQTVLATVEVLRTRKWSIPDSSVRNGLSSVVSNTGLRGRWDVLKERPKVICDTAHNREGLQYTMKQLLEEKGRSLLLVIGMVNDKDLDSILSLFPRQGRYFFCRPDIPRGLDAKLLKEKGEEFGLSGEVYSSVTEAYMAAVSEASDEDVIYIGGSTFTVAEII